jgi:hypothetical protein
MRNVFADVEEPPSHPGFYGWGKSTQTDIGNCVNGFLDGVAYEPAILCDGSKARLTPGIYWNLSANSNFFASSWRPTHPFVLWGVGAIGGQPSCPRDAGNCGPCNTACNTLVPVVNTWNAGVKKGCLAGNGIVIWQFWVGACGCSGDWDYSDQTPSDVFVPVPCRT